MFKKKLIDREDIRGADVIITGDLNARIGEVNENGEAINRKSRDKLCNWEGEKLLDFCQKNAFEIRNGRIEGDWEGKLTCISESGDQPWIWL